MCGIAGIFERQGRPVDPDVLVRMSRTLTHRGPDDEGYFMNRRDDSSLSVMANHDVRDGGLVTSNHCGAVGLGHRRLSIIDLASGHQPLSNEDGTVWISFNGEVYNFQQLQSELESAGHRFRTRCDTEAIVHAYEEWGVRCVDRFRGMFAFAIWDEKEQTLFLARDRVGKKPLYYFLDDRRLLFASELKGILEAPGIPRDIDLTAVSDFLSLLYVPAPKSIFTHIKKLPAGHYAVVRRDSAEVRPYWDLSFAPDEGRSEQAIMDEIVANLEQATRLRMISDVPLGAFLSGGVDSSAVVAMMARASTEPVVTNSISFSVSKYDETPFARQVADLFHTNHQEFHVTPEAIPAIENLSWHYDEPFADSSAVPTFYVSRTARDRVKVSLSGDGGDESFAGYRRYYFDARENQVRDLFPRMFSRHVFRAIGALYPKADYLPRIFRGKAFISNLARDPVDAYFFSVGAVHDDAKSALMRPDVRAALSGYRSVELFRDIYDRAPAEDHLSRIQYLDIKTYLCDDILAKVDRASMAVSLEVRCPLLDHVFLEHVARIPSRWKLSGSDGKHIFKKALRQVLPDDVLYRRKMGFGVPILEWLRRGFREYAEDLVLRGPATAAYLEASRVQNMWAEHQRGIRNWATELWAIMVLNLWHRRFL